MEKVLVEISVPAIDNSFDVFIPQKNKVSDVVLLVSRMVSELSEERFKPNSSTLLCDARTGDILDINLSVYEQEIRNGSKLMLI